VSLHQRLADAERELSQLRVTVAELRTLVGVLMHREVPLQDAPLPAARRRPSLRLVPAADSVTGQDMDEALRRVRAQRGEAR
jgi:hypothetical protein